MLTKLRALVLTQDRATVASLETAFGISGVACEIHTEKASAAKALSQSHFDGIVIDCDCAPAAETIREIRDGRSNKRCPFLVLVSDMAAIRQASTQRADLVLHKPVTITRLVPQLKVALLLMAREHLRYQRYPVNGPALVAWPDGRTFPGRTLNLSCEGLALTLNEAVRFPEYLHVRFDLPTKEPTAISASAETAWSDQHGRAGVHFRHMPPSSLERFHRGLAELRHRGVRELGRYGV